MEENILKFKPKPEPMNIKDAQTEANMLRAHMGQNPDDPKGNIQKEVSRLKSDGSKYEAMFNKWISREPTAKDYDLALKAIEEMRQLAETEPMSQKLLNSLGRIAAETGGGLLMALGAMTPSYPPGSTVTAFANLRDDMVEKFADASSRLKQLKKQAKEY